MLTCTLEVKGSKACKRDKCRISCRGEQRRCFELMFWVRLQEDFFVNVRKTNLSHFPMKAAARRLLLVSSSAVLDGVPEQEITPASDHLRGETSSLA